ncbi:hypothetical protein BSKO_13901 [Bryopsis sp. KO-2023]|nr:hypothetical protein BSKO_13901 [Bryopsis sp. KO-2023]
MVQQRNKVEIKRAKTKKGRLALQAREPQEVEDVKTALLIYGPRTTQVVKDVMTDLGKLKWNECTRFTQLHPDVRPFEAGGEVAVQNYCRKLDTGLFVVGSHSKKRPNNLVLGRIFDSQILDMLEIGIEGYKGMREFKHPGSIAGSKPMFAFVGEKFDTVPELKAMKSMFLDFFRGRVVSNILAAGLDRVILVVALSDQKVVFRHYKSDLKKRQDGAKGANVDLKENGPRINFVVRRFRAAPAELEKESLKELPNKKKEKNVKMDLVDGKVGRVYMPKQDVDSIVLAKPKGVKRMRREGGSESGGKKQKSKS